MRIGLHDGDGQTDFPNYALMKISAWHKAQGDEVEWYMPMMPYDKAYSSKVFTFTPVYKYLPADTIKGGTGYGLFEDLPGEIDAMFPDYSIYPNVDYAIGFLTRGCIRNCPWCVVPKKEGRIRPYRTWQEIKRQDSNKIVFMDNNILAHPYGIEQMESMIGQDVRIDFNQGLDARLVTKEIAKILGSLKWMRFIRTACDTDAAMDSVGKMVELVKAAGVKPYRIMVYVMTKDLESGERRVNFLKKLGVDPYVQPFRDFEHNVEPPQILKDFARYVNDKAIFKSIRSFAEYNKQTRYKK